MRFIYLKPLNLILALACLALAVPLWYKTVRHRHSVSFPPVSTPKPPPRSLSSAPHQAVSFAPSLASPRRAGSRHCKPAMRVVETPSLFRVVIATRQPSPEAFRVELRGSLLTIYTFASGESAPSPGELPLAMSTIMLPGLADTSIPPEVSLTNNLLQIKVHKP